MAVVQYTGIVNQIRGKVNGSVFNKSRNAFTLQKKQQQTKGSKGSQFEIRNVFSQVQRAWKDATLTQQSDWAVAAQNNPSRDRFGNQTILSGYNQYIKANILRWYANDEISPDVVPTTAPPVTITGFTLADLAFTRDANGNVIVSFEFGFDSSGIDVFGYVVDLSLPISRGVTTYYGRYVFIYGSIINTTSTSVVDEVTLSDKYVIPQSGQQVQLRLRVFYYANGAIVYTDVTSIIYG